MRVDFKVAILKSGRYQFQIASECGLSEGRLSRFIRGREQLRPEEELRLRTVLGLMAEVKQETERQLNSKEAAGVAG
jgi:plasmid maintenance system antidote protein VapI